jgi:hypothetical protein
MIISQTAIYKEVNEKLKNLQLDGNSIESIDIKVQGSMAYATIIYVVGGL